MSNTVETYFSKLETEKKEQIKRSGHSVCEYDLYCPYCAEAQNDLWDYSTEITEDPTTFECQKCDKTFFAQSKLTYSSTKLEDIE